MKLISKNIRVFVRVCAINLVLIAAGVVIAADDGPAGVGAPTSAALIDAARNGRVDDVRTLLDAHADPLRYVNRTDGCMTGNTALHWAAMKGHLGVVKLLLTAGAEVDGRCYAGQTALHKAAWNGKIRIVDLLLTAGADVDAKDRYDNTPLHKAAAGGHVEVVERLLAAGADVNAINRDGETVFSKAPTEGIRALIREAGHNRQNWSAARAAWCAIDILLIEPTRSPAGAGAATARVAGPSIEPAD